MKYAPGKPDHRGMVPIVEYNRSDREPIFCVEDTEAAEFVCALLNAKEVADDLLSEEIRHVEALRDALVEMKLTKRQAMCLPMEDKRWLMARAADILCEADLIPGPPRPPAPPPRRCS